MGHLRGGSDDLADLPAGGEGDADGAGEAGGAEAVSAGPGEVGGATGCGGGECIITIGAAGAGG